MRVLYVSKASVVAAHRGKLEALARHAQLTLLAPERWAARRFEADSAGAGEAYRVVRRHARWHGRNHLHVYRGLAGVLRPGAFDLVHVDEEPYSLVTAQVVRRAARLGVPSLFFAWQNIAKRIPAPFRALRQGVFRRVAGAFAGNSEAAEVLRAWGYRGPLAVVPQMGVDPDRFRPDPEARRHARALLGVPEGVLLVGYVGRLVPEKGVDLLLDAVASLPDAQALLLGEGPALGTLERRAHSFGARDRVHFRGDVPSLEVPRWMTALDVLVLPSRTTAGWKEQFGRVLVEAMATGVPVVGSSSGEIPRVIGDAGIVFREGDAGALAAALERLAEGPELRARLAREGHTRALALFSNERIAADTAAFWRELLSGSSKRGGTRAATPAAAAAGDPQPPGTRAVTFQRSAAER